MRKQAVKLFGWTLGKECGGRWFPEIGRGRWDGLRYFLLHSQKINIKPEVRRVPRTGKRVFCFGPLMLWKDSVPSDLY